MSKCTNCDGFGYIGDGPFTSGTKCPDCDGTGTMTQPNQYEDKELEQRINDADTIAALDELRMDIVESKDRRLLKLWQDKFWERKKKYSYAEVQQLITQKQLEALEHDNALTLGHIQAGMPIERLKGVIERRLAKYSAELTKQESKS